MASPAISVIVPVYNVEQYLDRCVRSLLSQTFKDMEIILVDDGSTDGSGTLCDTLAAKDMRIRVLHKKNGGLSDARNAGVDIAVGKYIYFVDSDDFIEPNCSEVLYTLIEENDADIAVGGIYNCYETHRTPQCDERLVFNCNGVEALEKMLEGRQIPGSSCCKMMRTDLAKQKSFIVGRTYEDAFYLPQLILDVKKITVTTEPLYNYWHRSNSITTVAFNERAMDLIDAYAYTYDLVSEKCPSLLPLANFRVWWAHFVVLDRILLLKNYRDIPQYKQVVATLKKNWLNIMRCNYFQSSRRISALALKLCVSFYRFLSIIKNRREGING